MSDGAEDMVRWIDITRVFELMCLQLATCAVQTHFLHTHPRTLTPTHTHSRPHTHTFTPTHADPHTHTHQLVQYSCYMYSCMVLSLSTTQRAIVRHWQLLRALYYLERFIYLKQLCVYINTYSMTNRVNYEI